MARRAHDDSVGEPVDGGLGGRPGATERGHAMGGGVELTGILPGELTTVRVSKLKLHPRNPRRGNVVAIKESLRVNGQVRPLLVNRRDMIVLAGNHTLRCMRELGFSEALVYVIDVDEECATRIMLVDNRTADLAGYDTEELVALLQALGDLGGTGYEQGDLDALLDELAEGVPVEDDEVPPVPAEPLTQVGELVELGAHRLVCGDARDPAVYRLLMGAELASLLWTDPMYGVDFAGRTPARLRIENDQRHGLNGLLVAAFHAADAVLAAGSPLYVLHSAGPTAGVFVDAFVTPGWQLREVLVWVKDSPVLGLADYHFRHEPVLYGFKPGPGRLGRGGPRWHGGNRQSTVLEVPRPRSSQQHATMKPPELVAIALRNSSSRGALVLDPFAGSGSTLVACEQLGRVARLIEIDPGYCDVIVERYERLTGTKAIRTRRAA
jgi:DNA modification methylase